MLFPKRVIVLSLIACLLAFMLVGSALIAADRLFATAMAALARSFILRLLIFMMVLATSTFWMVILVTTFGLAFG